ncbi:MAG: hypothetical protein ABWZ80_05795 [Beijerinckiaceae bacterium]
MTESRVTVVAATLGLGVLALAGLAWLANADAVFVDLLNAALAMCM